MNSDQQNGAAETNPNELGEGQSRALIENTLSNKGKKREAQFPRGKDDNFYKLTDLIDDDPEDHLKLTHLIFTGIIQGTLTDEEVEAAVDNSTKMTEVYHKLNKIQEKRKLDKVA